jgi:hypothetical protein
MSVTVSTQGIRTSRSGTAAALLALLLSVTLASCSKSQRTPEASAQRTFASPEEAGAALLAAAKSGDRNGLVAIFGPDSGAVLLTGDVGSDRARLNDFVTAYNQMHRWGAIQAGGEVLLVGADNNAFPIPLGRNAAGKWYFDTAAGKDEILARRIGKDELTAMDASKAVATAQHQYYQETHDGDQVKRYAQKFVSDPGKQNGLYWPAAEGQTPSPLAGLGDFENSGTTDDSREFNGYRYRILSKGATPKGVTDYVVDGKMTGGFAILAYPVEYRNSGITSFLIGQDGTLYQKDLGVNTVALANSLTEYNPGDDWTPVNPAANTASRLQP